MKMNRRFLWVPALVLTSLAARPASAALRPVGYEVAMPLERCWYDLAPTAAFGAAGDLLVAWRDFDGLRGQLLRPDGRPAGRGFALGGDPGAPLAGDSPRLLAVGDGTHLLARQTPEGLVFRRLGAGGELLGDDRVVLAPGFWLYDLVLSAEGEVGILRAEGGADSSVLLHLRRLSLDGEVLGPDREVAVIEQATERWYLIVPRVAAGDDGGFLVTWFDPVEQAVGLVALDESGAPLGPARALSSGDGKGAAVATPGGGYLVAWRHPADGSVHAQTLDAEGKPLGPPRVVRPGIPGTLNPFSPLLARSGHGVALVWQESADGAEPRLMARALRLDGRPAGSPFPLHAPIDELPGLGGREAYLGTVTVAAGPSGRYVALWTTGISTGAGIPTACDGGRAVLARLFEDPEAPPPPLPGVPVEALGLPGYEIQVRISSPGVVTEGTLEADCLPEAACFSGAVPGRTEVIVRVAGPKPNGRLWPLVMSASTSWVEVWIRKLGGTELRYYRLDPGDPESERLPGTYDRTGFQP